MIHFKSLQFSKLKTIFKRQMISNNHNIALLSIPFDGIRDWTTMSKFNIQGCLQVFDIIVHLNFLLVGLYFVYHGEIFPRYLKRRTQFAEFEENITEIPTIFTYIEFKRTLITPLKYGSDFNISFGVVGHGEPKNLTQGNNTIYTSQLKLHLEEQNEFSTNLEPSFEKRLVLRCS